MNQMQQQMPEEQAKLQNPGQIVQEQIAAQQPVYSPGMEADYPGALDVLFPVARENKDLVNFAYYLYKQELNRAPQDDGEWVGIDQAVNFCDCNKSRSTNNLMNASRLEQLYLTDMFTDRYGILWSKKENFSQEVQNRCGTCSFGDAEGVAFCPYRFCHLVVSAAKELQISPEKLFADILGEDLIPFRGTTVHKLDAEIPAEDLQGIHAKSAHSAYLLLAGKLLHVSRIEDATVYYSHVPLCRGDQKTSFLAPMIDLWKTGSGVACTLQVNDKVGLLHGKTEGCKKCGYVQCPHKLAAYFCYLGSKYRVDPIDLAYHVAKSNTYAGISMRDNFQFNRYLEAIKAAPMREASKDELIKMFHFIAGRRVNSAIPFLPFNLALSSPDKEKSNEIVDLFCNALWHFDYYRRGHDNTKRKELYLSSLTFGELCSEYQQANPGTTMILHDVFLLSEDKDFTAGYHRLLKIMEDRREAVMSVLMGEKEELAAFLAKFPAFRKIFTKGLEMVNMDSDAILDALVDKLTQTFTIPEEVHQNLEQYIRLTYPASAKQGMEYVADLYENLLFNHYNYDVNANAELRRSDIPYVEPPRSEQEIFEEINRLTGLENVKQEMRNVHDLIKFNIKMENNKKNPVNMHMVFTGNPGTGKTTVARLMAEILYSIGFIQENKLVMCSAKDLIGEYMGQTTPKTAKKCEQAYNGVLFIDEAYQLNPASSDRGGEYREECIAELIQQMENNRDRLVVIFAGYTQEMEDFLNRANTGLRSRIGKTIHFPDYSAAELLEIFTKIVKDGGMKLGEGVAIKALDIFKNAKADAQRFGNARFARNLYERSLLQHAAITANLDKDDPALRILQRDELTLPGG